MVIVAIAGIVIGLVVGVAAGYTVGLSQAKKMTAENTLSREDQEMIHQVLNVLSFGGSNEDQNITN